MDNYSDSRWTGTGTCTGTGAGTGAGAIRHRQTRRGTASEASQAGQVLHYNGLEVGRYSGQPEAGRGSGRVAQNGGIGIIGG